MNITPDHLDRYDYDFKKYARAKWQLYLHTHDNGLVILNKDNQATMDMLNAIDNEKELVILSASDPRILYSTECNKNFDITLKGKHNAYNAAVAVKIAERLGVNCEQVQDGLLSFNAVEHRIEPVSTIGKVSFINDSKATNIDAVQVALEALDHPIIWIVGGVDKGNDYMQIYDLVKEKVTGIVCMTKFPEKIMQSFGDLGIPIEVTEDTNEAIKIALDLSSDKAYALLSPACASFDLFDNYEHRGRAFKEAVFKMKNEID